MPHVTVQVRLGEYTFRGRSVESLEIRQAVGEHTECTLVFDRDPRATERDTANVKSAALVEATLQVILAQTDDPAAGGQNGSPAGGVAGTLFGGQLVSTAVLTAKAAAGAAIKTALTNRHGSGRITTNAVLTDAGKALAPQLGGGVSSLLGAAGVGSANGGPSADAAQKAATEANKASRDAPDFFTGAGLEQGLQATAAGVAQDTAASALAHRSESGRNNTNAALGALGNVANAQAGAVVDYGAKQLFGGPAAGAASAAGGLAAGAPGAADAPATEFLAFDGRVREVTVDYGPNGTARFTVRAFSKSYELAAHAEQRYFAKQTIAGLAKVFDVGVTGQVPAGQPRDYIQRGESDYAFIASRAAVEGLQFRATWGRHPGESTSEPAEIAEGFADAHHVLLWGRNLTKLGVTVRPTNHGVSAHFTDPKTKHTHTFNGVRKDPEWMGGAQALVDALKAAAPKDAGGGDPGNVNVGGLGGTQARNLDEFRTRLERASEARLGGAIHASGTSTEPKLRAGDRIVVSSGGSGGAGNGAGGTWGAVGSDERDGVYGLTSVTHHYKEGNYENTFTATPWKGYHPSPKAVQDALARAVVALGGADAAGAEHGAGTTSDGVTIATVFDDDDPQKLGRVRVQYAYQRGQDASHWLRVAGHGGGKGHGAGHVPLKGNMVAVAPVKNDDEHPLVIGAVYDQTDAGGHTKDRIQMVSRSGSGFSINTGQGGASDHVELHTPSGAAMVRCHGDRVTIHAEGNIAIEAPNGEVRIVAKSMTTEISTNDVREVKGDVHDTVHGSVLREITGDVHDTVHGGVTEGIKGAALRNVKGDSTLAAANVKLSSRGTLDATAPGVHTIKGGKVNINS